MSREIARYPGRGVEFNMVVLLIAGVGAIVAGLLAIWFGIPVKEFSFGNTLILAGVVGVCSGLLLIGLSLVVRQLKVIAQRLRVIEPETRLRDIGGPPLPAGSIADSDRDLSETGTPTSLRDPFSDRDAAANGSAGMPWRDEAAARERGRTAVTSPATLEPTEAEELTALQSKQRRNLLFTSSRRERERVQAREAEATSDRVPPPMPLESGVTKPEPHPSFDEAWPKVDRARRDPASSHAASPLAAAPHADANAAAKSEPESPQVTVVKSGVVDGMAYSLYSDGSIEAQMPEGMMRFASIDELRQHLDQRP